MNEVLKRLWFVISCCWALFALWAGSMSQNGIQNIDVYLAASPFVLGIVLRVLFRYVRGHRHSEITSSVIPYPVLPTAPAPPPDTPAPSGGKPFLVS